MGPRTGGPIDLDIDLQEGGSDNSGELLDSDAEIEVYDDLELGGDEMDEDEGIPPPPGRRI